MAFQGLFPVQPPAVSTGRATEEGVAIGKEAYAGSPRVAGNNVAAGQSVGIVKEGRIPVILFTGGFHTP